MEKYLLYIELHCIKYNNILNTIESDVFKDKILLHPASKSHSLPMANAAFIPLPVVE